MKAKHMLLFLNCPSIHEHFPWRKEKNRDRNVAPADNTGSDKLFPQIWAGLLCDNWRWNQSSISQLSVVNKLRYLISQQRDI